MIPGVKRSRDREMTRWFDQLVVSVWREECFVGIMLVWPASTREGSENWQSSCRRQKYQTFGNQRSSNWFNWLLRHYLRSRGAILFSSILYQRCFLTSANSNRRNIMMTKGGTNESNLLDLVQSKTLSFKYTKRRWHLLLEIIFEFNLNSGFEFLRFLKNSELNFLGFRFDLEVWCL